MSEAEPVEVPRQVYCELKTLRQMGVDPVDPDAVLARLDDYEFEAALDWVLENPDEYVRTVRAGMVDGTVPGED